MRQPHIRFDVTVEHLETCDPQYLLDHHNRPGEQLISIVVDPTTTWAEARDLVDDEFEDIADEMFDDQLDWSSEEKLKFYRSVVAAIQSMSLPADDSLVNPMLESTAGHEESNQHNTTHFLIKWSRVEAPSRSELLDRIEATLIEVSDGRWHGGPTNIAAERIVRELEERELLVALREGDEMVGVPAPAVEVLGPLVYNDDQRGWAFDGKTNVCCVRSTSMTSQVYQAIRLCDGDEPVGSVEELHDWLARHGGPDLVWEGDESGIIITQTAVVAAPRSETVRASPGEWIIFFGPSVGFGGGYKRQTLDSLYTFERVPS